MEIGKCTFKIILKVFSNYCCFSQSQKIFSSKHPR